MTLESFCFLFHDAVSLNQHQEDKALSSVSCCLPFSQSIFVGRVPPFMSNCYSGCFTASHVAASAGSTAQVVVSLLAEGDGLLFGVWRLRNSHHSALSAFLSV